MKYFMFRCYYADYGIQGKPVLIPWKDVIEHQRRFKRGLEKEDGITWAKHKAAEETIRWDFKPHGRITRGQYAIIERMEIQSMQVKDLNEKQVRHYRSMRIGGLRVHVRAEHYSSKYKPVRRRIHKFSKLHRRF